MRVYLESRFFGKSGGEETLVRNILKTKPENIILDLNVIVKNEDDNFIFGKNSQLVKAPTGKYDIGIKLGLLGNSNDLMNGEFGQKIFCPCGYEFSIHGMYNQKIYDYYDIIWKESVKISSLEKERIICPPVILEYESPKTNNILSSFCNQKYYVTLANFYDIDVKGIDLIYEFAETSKYPLLWFVGDNKNNCEFPNFKKTKNLKIAKNIPYNVIMDTVKNSYAYICFSRSEGFGNAIAEAICLDKPIITRKVGVINYYPDKFNLYNEIDEIDSLELKEVNYNEYKDLFSNGLWREILGNKNGY